MTDQLGLVEVEEVDAVEIGGGSDLVRMAMDKDIDLDKLERIIALQERGEERAARRAFVQALTDFRRECPQPHKTRENSQFQVTRDGTKRASRYAPLEEIEKTVRPVAAKFGLTWTWDTKLSGEMIEVVCKVQHIDGHSDTATVAMPYESKAGSSPQQKYGSTQTYGMRYSLIAALGITTSDEDVDGASSEQSESITDGQADYLKNLLHETDSDVPKFLKWLGIASVEDMTQADFPRAVKGLEAKKGKDAHD